MDQRLEDFVLGDDMKLLVKKNGIRSSISNVIENLRRETELGNCDDDSQFIISYLEVLGSRYETLGDAISDYHSSMVFDDQSSVNPNLLRTGRYDL